MAKRLTITVGRNIGSEPMDNRNWNLFLSETALTMRAFTDGRDRWAETHHGTGVWDGVAEDSAMLTMHNVEGDIPIGSLSDALSYLARKYGQDAISVSVGEEFLVNRK